MTKQAGQQGLSILFEMLRSFTTLADTLNLSQAVDRLNSTRQTVRRHIALLEESRGEELFVLVNRQYQLTDAGRRALPEAEELLTRGQAWMESRLGHVGQLQQFSVTPSETEQGYFYYLQQQPLTRIWDAEGSLLREGLKLWTACEGNIEDPAFAEFRENAMVFRLNDGVWLCTEVGQQSAFAKWFGWTWAKSTIGRTVEALPGGGRYNVIALQAYQELLSGRGVRLDHVVTQMPYGSDGTFEVIGFERLLMAFRYPDKSFALVSVVNLSRDLDVYGVGDTLKRQIFLDVG
ncbi:LysR family transcriptional regulator [Mesobacterium pallidum]|uniref:LysR family transcriptional regulator n=1 Tax=Mesobacterium pallidum TaxID=2872037 RepID=UPI001EE2B390|nr:LysR family transcriptional regulator [Mesobacterium pallidum]